MSDGHFTCISHFLKKPLVGHMECEKNLDIVKMHVSFLGILNYFFFLFNIFFQHFAFASSYFSNFLVPVFFFFF
jgi:hypothetical protein